MSLYYFKTNDFMHADEISHFKFLMWIALMAISIFFESKGFLAPKYLKTPDIRHLCLMTQIQIVIIAFPLFY